MLTLTNSAEGTADLLASLETGGVLVGVMEGLPGALNGLAGPDILNRRNPALNNQPSPF